MSRSQVFVGSSGEGLSVAEPLAARLESLTDVSVWNESNLFTLTHSTLESLIDSLADADFAVLVLTADDVTTSRGRRRSSPRDNVIFECGLFVGALGRSRTFLVCDRDLKLPSDLAGVTVTFFDESRLDTNPEAAVRDPYLKISRAIKAVGPRVHRSAPLRRGNGGSYTGFHGRERKPEFRRAYRVSGYLAQFVERHLIEAGGEKRLVTPREDRFSKLGINPREGTWKVVCDDKGIYVNAVTAKRGHPLLAEYLLPDNWPAYSSWDFAGEVADELLRQLGQGVATVERPSRERPRTDAAARRPSRRGGAGKK